VPASDPAKGGCSEVFTGEDATAIYGVLGSQPLDATCKFGGVKVSGSSASISYKVPDGSLVTAELKPLVCVPQPIDGATVQAPYHLVVSEQAAALCPVASAGLIAAVKGALLPPPSKGR